MFLQLPIFIGLYRGLSVDILLRQAPLIPGISWCSNLAGPDKLVYWANVIPAFLSNPTGWLGPYLNVLPLVTCVLFLLQQKMFTPPATDEQQKMQQQVMQFMMLFMALLFFKVASGLCVYFIASSVWGLAERMLLPKSKPPSDDQPAAKPEASSDRDASATAAAKAKRKRQRRR
jgi:YidC/Oxa1 family membrane protein insertase